MKNNKKDIYKEISSERKAGENAGTLLNEGRALEAEDIETDEAHSAPFATLFPTLPSRMSSP